MNEKWTMYLMASINKHFETYVVSDSDLPVTLFVEGFERTDVQENAENLVEVRYTGPFWSQLSATSWKVTIIINCALQTVIGRDNYKIWRLFGKVTKAFATAVSIKTYGETVLTEIGCLQLKTNKDDIINNFLGQVDPGTKRVQGEVTAHYTIDLEDAS